MTIRRTLTSPVPGTPAEILQRLGDPDVAAARAASDPTLHAQVTELYGGEGELHMTLVAELPASWIPAPVRSRLQTTPRIVRRETWLMADDGAAYADVDVVVEGVPATTMTSTARIARSTDDPGSSDLTYLLSLTVALPIVGGVVERTVMEQIARGYEKEAHVIAGR